MPKNAVGSIRPRISLRCRAGAWDPSGALQERGGGGVGGGSRWSGASAGGRDGGGSVGCGSSTGGSGRVTTKRNHRPRRCRSHEEGEALSFVRLGVQAGLDALLELDEAVDLLVEL